MAKAPILIIVLLASCCADLLADDFPSGNFANRYIFKQSSSFPQSISLIVWLEGAREENPLALSTLGEERGAQLTISVDREGIPTALATAPNQPPQACRASTGGTNLFDGSVHSFVATANLSSGLVRLYVDGKPEAAAVLTSWRPRHLDRAYVYCGENSFPSIAFGNRSYVSRLISRELSDPEIAALSPPSGKPLVLSDNLLGSTLIEFLPPMAEAKRSLRERP